MSFLDINGVLNKQSDWKRQFSLNDECCHWFNFEYEKKINKDKEVLWEYSLI